MMTTNVPLSTQTLSVLKNFSQINPSIVVKKGNVLKTISSAENIISVATIEEEFPQDFSIYELNQFIAGLSLFENPILIFDNADYLTIKDSTSSRRVKYYFSDPSITLKSAPDKGVKFPGGNINFTITHEGITSLLKANSVYNLPDLTFNASDGEITLAVGDRENDTSNTYEQVIKGETTGDYKLQMKIENLRLLPGDYDVKISEFLISEWKHTKLDVIYYIALEP
jgi:hypothetical protein